MVAALIAGFCTQRPLAMIDGEGRSIAVANNGITAYALKTPTKYVRENWQSVWGNAEFNNGKPIKEKNWQEGDVSLICDDYACRIMKGDAHLSILLNANAIHEECVWADAIVSIDKAAPEGTCDKKLIKYWNLRKMGGVAFYPDGRIIGMTPAGEDRPWTMH